MYTAYSENVEGVYGAGETVAEAKQSVLDAIRLLKEYNTDQHIPDTLKGEYELSYRFQSLLDCYRGIFTNAALERMTGINQRQWQHYASGLKKPRAAQINKIETALHRLGNELLAVEL